MSYIALFFGVTSFLLLIIGIPSVATVIIFMALLGLLLSLYLFISHKPVSLATYSALWLCVFSIIMGGFLWWHSWNQEVREVDETNLLRAQLQYEQVQPDMSYNDVMAIYGCQGEKVFEEHSEKYGYLVTYKWVDSNDEDVFVNFQNDKVTLKDQE